MLVTFRPGDVVCYVDTRGVAHRALVSHWFGNSSTASCNLVYLDSVKRDVHGMLPVQVSNVHAYDGLSRTRTHYWAEYPLAGEAGQGRSEGGL